MDDFISSSILLILPCAALYTFITIIELSYSALTFSEIDFSALLLKSTDSLTYLSLSPHSFWINKILENTSHTPLINISSFLLIVGTVGMTNKAHDRFAIYLYYL